MTTPPKLTVRYSIQFLSGITYSLVESRYRPQALRMGTYHSELYAMRGDHLSFPLANIRRLHEVICKSLGDRNGHSGASQRM